MHSQNYTCVILIRLIHDKWVNRNQNKFKYEINDLFYDLIYNLSNNQYCVQTIVLVGIISHCTLIASGFKVFFMLTTSYHRHGLIFNINVPTLKQQKYVNGVHKLVILSYFNCYWFWNNIVRNYFARSLRYNDFLCEFQVFAKRQT